MNNMDPTQQQLANQLNPTPTTIYLPNEGIFTDSTSPGATLYMRVGNVVKTFDITSILTPEQRKNTQNYGEQVDLAKSILKSQYNFDPDTATKVNLADYWQSLARQGIGSTQAGTGSYIAPLASGELKDFFNVKPATLTSTEVNTGKNYLAATPQPLASATPSSSPLKEPPSTYLEPGMTGEEVKKLQDYLVQAGYMTQEQVNTGYGTYGPQTQNAVAALQQKLGVDTSGGGVGYFGPKTIAALSGSSTTQNSTTTTSQGVSSPGSISTSGLSGSATPVPVVTPTKDTSTADSLVASAQAALDAYKAGLAQTTPTETQYGALSKEISALLPSLTGRGEAQLAKEQELGIPGIKTQLADLGAQVQTKLAEYTQLKTQYEATSVENRGKPITMSSIIGNEAQIQYARASALNAKAAEIGLLQAQAQGLEGKLQVAQETANRAIDLKYKDIETLINVKIQQLDLLKDQMNKEQLKKADILDKQYALQLQQIADKKAEDKTRTNQLLDWMAKYPDAGITTSDTLENAQSKVTQNSTIYKNEVNKKTSDIKSNEPLSILDVQRYNELFPSAGVVAGDTESTANEKVSKIKTPETDIRSQITAAKTNGNSYETVVNEIKNDPTIKDKETAIKIVDEVYKDSANGGGLWNTWTDWLAKTLFE